MIPEAKLALDIARAQTIVRLIKPLLGGHGPEVQGAVLADLVSIWLAGHHPALRDGVFNMWIDTTRKLVPESEREIFGDAGFPMEGLS